jgi:acyl-CoA synthetase (AMP-forming)/AMP-acid ligase II
MQSTMMFAPLSLNGVLERAGTLFRDSEIITRLPDKSLRRHTHGAWYWRTRALASALQRFGLKSRRCAGTTTPISRRSSASPPRAASCTR